MAPLYKKTVSRVKREQKFKQIITSIKIDKPFTLDSIKYSPVFCLFLEGKSKEPCVSIFQKYLEFYPYFKEFDNYWKKKHPHVCFFRDMNEKTLISHGFVDDLHNSLIWYLSESILRNDLNWGLYLARKRILQIYKNTKDLFFPQIDSFFILEHHQIELEIEKFIMVL